MSKVLDVIVRSLSYIKLHKQPHLIPVEMFKLVSKRSSVFESARSVRLTHQENGAVSHDFTAVVLMYYQA